MLHLALIAVLVYWLLPKFFLFTNYHISVADLFYACRFSFVSRQSTRYTALVHRLQQKLKPALQETGSTCKSFSNEYISLAYSCRTAFYLVLEHLRRGGAGRRGEVIMSGLTIRNFVNLVEYFGYTVVPWDVDLDTGYPLLDQLDNVLSPNTKMVVITHLMGITIDPTTLEKIVCKIKSYNKDILVIEDRAQSFAVPSDMLTDVILYSFGSSKMYSALRGGAFVTRDIALHQSLDAINHSLPEPSRLRYLQDLWDALLVILATRPRITYCICGVLKLCAIDYKEFIEKHYTAYPSKAAVEIFRETLPKILYKNQVPAAFLLEKRLANLHDQHVEKKTEIGDYATQELHKIGAQIVGGGVRERSYWIYCICVDGDRELLMTKLAEHGFGVSKTATSFNSIDLHTVNKTDTFDGYIKNCVYFREHCVYLPITSDIGKQDIDRIVAILQKELY